MKKISLLLGFILTAAQFGIVSCASSNKKTEGKLSEKVAPAISNAKQLVFSGARSGEAYFSQDGKQIVFQSEREPGNPFYQIYLMDIESGDTKRISPGHGKTSCAWIHPDKKRIMYSSTHLDPKSKEHQKKELDFRASGQTRRYSWDYDENYDIFEADTNGKILRRLTRTRGYDAEGSYSPDGKKIAFASNRTGFDKNISAEDKKRFETDPSYMMEIYIMNADGSGVKRLTNSPGYDGGPFFSPDGQRITWRRFSPDGKSAEIYTMNIDGTDQRQITRIGAMSWAPFYHPSGDYIIFTTNVLGYHNFELYIVDVQGHRDPVRVTDLEGFDGLPVFSPDGKKLAWAAKSAGGASQVFMADWNDAVARKALGLPSSNLDTSSFSPEIKEDDIKSIVNYLAAPDMKGRMTGSIEEDIYSRALAKMFSDLGLQPWKGSYIHPFSYTAGVQLGVSNSFKVSTLNRDLVVGQDWIPVASSASGRFSEGEVVFAGYGIVAPDVPELGTYDSYQGLDVRDKWVMILRFVPEDVTPKIRAQLQRYSRIEHKVMVARERGARGIIVVTGPQSKAKSDLILLRHQRGSSGGSLPVVSLSTKVASEVLKVEKKDLKALQKELDKGVQLAGFKFAETKVQSEVTLNEMIGRGLNVIARLPANEKRPSRFSTWVGAHGDHLGQGESEGSLAKKRTADMIHYGADDNASGVAGVLELAAHFSKQAKGQLKQDLVFAIWSGEELGNLGSTALIKSLKPQDRVSAYINMDMIGRLQEKLIVQGLGSSADWGAMMEKVSRQSSLSIQPQTDPYLPTDALSFYVAGFPILSFFTGSHLDYHTPTDTPEKLNYKGLVDIVTYVGKMVEAVALEDRALKYQQTERKQMQMGGGRGFRIFLGTIPDYAQEKAKGVKISGVIKGGPAERAGLKGGDIIVELSGLKIEGIQDYVYSLEAIKPGEKTKIVVMRGGAEVPLEIVPATRD